MAELSYDDVRQAARAAVSELQGAISDIRNNIQTARSEISRLNNDDIRNRLSNLEKIIGSTVPYLQRLDAMQQTTQAIPASLQQVAQLTLRLEQRVVNAEHMIADMSQYLEVIHQQVVQLLELHTQAPSETAG